MNLEKHSMRRRVGPANSFVEFEKAEIEQSIASRFEHQVAKYPDRLAVKAKDHEFTYTELNQVANRIARAILARVGEGEEPVALLFEHGASIIAAILGVLKAGKFYVSLDPAFPQARIGDMLADSEAKLLLTNKKHLSQAQQLTLRGQDILDCDGIEPRIDSGNLDLPISPDTCALILYTSGSTGRPKGVLHNHRNILVETRTYTNDLGICPEDRLALWHSCSYANSIRNLYGALLNGTTLFPYDLTTEGFAPLDEWIRTHRITIIHTLATTFRRFCDTVSADATFPALRILRLGGEPINMEDVKRFQRHFSPQCVLVHAMGPTETFTIRRHFISHDWRSSDSKIPVGYAVPDKEVFLLNETGSKVGADQIGEIAVRSKYLALGYWHRPDLTEAAFIPDPRGGDERLYLTGDLGQMRPDGCLIHMGRKDFQVKIRGYRVEVAEIEIALLGLDSIKAAVVHAQADNAGEQRLVAYVVPAGDGAPTVGELHRALAQTLPDYMIPSAFVSLDSLPLLPNGKIDRRALPAPNQARPETGVALVSPRTSVERELTRIWEEMLGLERVGIHDNFFDLGGHSLLAARMFAKIHETFGKKLPLSTLFHGATIQHMASIIDEPTQSNRWSSLVAIQPQGTRPPFFCIHELSGDVLCYMNLARHLGQDQPLYALQARGLDGAEEPFDSIEAMSAYYVEAIRNVQPRGPYALGGLSFGGTVAFEMAQQLRAKGEPVAMVALLDSNAEYDEVTWQLSFLPKLFRDLPSWLIGSFQLNRSQWHDLIRLKFKRARARLGVSFRSAPELSESYAVKLIKEMGDLFHFSEQHRKVALVQYQARKRYRPRRYPGRLTLFRARMQPLLSSHDPENGWGGLAAGGLDIKVVPGNHLGMLQEPHVQVLAEQLKLCLEQSLDSHDTENRVDPGLRPVQ